MYTDEMPAITDQELSGEVWELRESYSLLGQTRHKLPNHGRCQECKRRGRAVDTLVQEQAPKVTKFAKFSLQKAKGSEFTMKLARPATRRKDGKILCEICSGGSGTKLVIDGAKKKRTVKTVPLLLPSSDKPQFTT